MKNTIIKTVIITSLLFFSNSIFGATRCLGEPAPGNSCTSITDKVKCEHSYNQAVCVVGSDIQCAWSDDGDGNGSCNYGRTSCTGEIIKYPSCDAWKEQVQDKVYPMREQNREDVKAELSDS